MNGRKTGRHYVHPNSFIIVLSYIKSYFHLPYRQTEGVVKAVGKERPDHPSYSQINRRVNQLHIKLDKAKEKDGAYVIIAIDSTGIKITNRGQWMRDKWDIRKKGYLKMHLAVNIKTKEILSLEVTDEKVHDSRIMCRLISNIQAKNAGKIRVFADGTYDTNANFMYLSSRQIQPIIRVRRNAIICKRNCCSRKSCNITTPKRLEEDNGIWKEVDCIKKLLFYIQEDVW